MCQITNHWSMLWWARWTIRRTWTWRSILPRRTVPLILGLVARRTLLLRLRPSHWTTLVHLWWLHTGWTLIRSRRTLHTLLLHIMGPVLWWAVRIHHSWLMSCRLVATRLRWTTGQQARSWYSRSWTVCCRWYWSRFLLALELIQSLLSGQSHHWTLAVQIFLWQTIHAQAHTWFRSKRNQTEALRLTIGTILKEFHVLKIGYANFVTDIVDVLVGGPLR